MKSSTRDIQIYEAGGGGEMYLINGDLAFSETLYQTIYLALFGGNVEASTTGHEIDEQERFDYWANSLLFKDEKSKQFNSETERTIRNTTINPSGRLLIEDAVKKDLSFLSDIVDVDVDVSILNYNSIEIKIRLSGIANQSDKSVQFVWDNAKSDLIIKKIIE